ncbi:MAG TPA: adenylate/guanylate cyclase domain-containing protein [Gallionella sp.]|nr:adenylate/guanylate cyclase domain-containing protein [Gallionella sp.]
MTKTASSSVEREMAVLFADVSGSTRLYELLGDTKAFAAINGCLDLLRRVTIAHGGHVVKTIGDEIMAVLPHADAAVQAACEMQAEVSARPSVENTRIEIRIGLHFGSVIETDADVFGDTVNIASRMANIAKSGQIITSDATVAKLHPVIKASARLLDALTVKGKAEDIRVFEIVWHESEETTMLVGATHALPVRESAVRLVHQGSELFINAGRPAVVIGRDEQADIVVEDRRASRIHAKIERRRDKFVLIDQSSNGSYVTIRGENEIQLRREEFVLHGSGSISLGHSYARDPSEVVEFFCLY